MLTCRFCSRVTIAVVLALLAPGWASTAEAQTVLAANVEPAVGAKLTFRGEWSPDVRYETDDLVTTRGSTWRARRASRGKVPGSTRPSTAAYWEVIASGLNPLGAWNAAERYHSNDVVTHLGTAWRALRTSVNKVPGLARRDWETLAAKGDAGSAGPQGATGPAGPQGEAGPQGVAGEAGAQGPQGPQGAQGPQGESGAQGAKGLQWRGAWSNATAYVADDGVQLDGRAYVALQDGTDKNPATEPAFWSLLADKGEKGDKGDKGDQGDPGAQGAQGPAGAQGAQGPQGPQGEQGPQGAQGPQGPAGPNSVADGSVSAPSISFASSPNTGIFSPATGKIALAAGGGLFLHSNGALNTALGVGALQDNTSGERNTAVGVIALRSNTTGNQNTAVGYGALQSNTTDGANTAVGYEALTKNTTGFFNTALGRQALRDNTTADNNVAVGHSALLLNVTGRLNTGLGAGALSNNTGGNGNIAIGTSAGLNPTNPSNSIFIGNSGLAADTHTIKIGTQGTQTSAFIGGIRGRTTGVNDAINVLIDSNGQLGTVSSSRRYKDDIRPMRDMSAVLMKLRPVMFRYKKPYADGAKPIQYGLIAEDVAEMLPDLAVFNKNGQPETVKYRLLPPLLVSAYQEQQKTIRAQAVTISALEQRLRRIEAQLARLGAAPARPVGQTADAGGAQVR